MNKKMGIMAVLSMLLSSCVLPKPFISLIATDTPTPSQTSTPTRTQTQTRSPTSTSTQALTIKPSKTFTLTLKPTLGTCEREGESFELSGYLALLEGSFTLDASSYIIALYFEKTGSDRIMVKIQGGNKSDSMYFQNKTPNIRNHYGAIIPWMTQGGVTTYKTAYEVTITGTYITRYVDRYNHTTGSFQKSVECTPSIETII